MFYTGIVESRDDPLEIGRVRVRVIGIHSQSQIDVPTEVLPWASVLQPATSSGSNGVGQTPKLTIGSFVLVYFADGENMQQPIVMGSLAGVQQQANILFNGEPLDPKDPDAGFTSLVDSDYLQESDIPRNARSGASDKLRERIRLSGSVSFEEPEDLRPNRQYPYTQVRQSESGHIEEWDDTPGNERIMTEHKSGTFNEMRPDGTQVTKVVGDGFEIVAQDKNVFVKGDCNIFVRGDCNLSVSGDYNIDVNGDINYNVQGNIFYNVADTIQYTVNGDISNYVVGDITYSVGGDIDESVVGDRVSEVGNSRYEVTHSKSSRIVGGAEANTVYGNSSHTIGGDSAKLVYGNAVDSFNADFSSNVFGNYTISTQGNMDLAALGEMAVQSTAKMDIFTADSFRLHSGVDLEVAAGSNLKNSAANVEIYSGGTYDVQSSGAVNIDGSTIDLNSGGASATNISAEDPREVEIKEEDAEAFLQTQPNEEDIAQVEPVVMEVSDDEIIIDFPDDTQMSTTQGPVTLDDYTSNFSNKLGGGASGARNSETTENGFNTSTYDGEGRTTSKFERVSYNLGGTRNKVVNSVLEELLSNAARATNIDEVVIYSGKQPGTTGGRTGSKRHDTGFAADIYLIKNGRKLDSSKTEDRELMKKYIQVSVAMGIRGAGHSKGYMGTNNIHVDTLGRITNSQGSAWDSSQLSTWLSDSWFIEAVHNPDKNYSPSQSYVAAAETPPEITPVDENNRAPVVESKEVKEVANLLGQACMRKGFSEEEALAAISCAYHESKFRLVEESSYARTSNDRIRKIFAITRKLSDSQLNSLKANKTEFFEYIYGYKTRTGKNLGNNKEGDGGKYIGRGLIQLTGKWNYKTYGGSQALSNPEALSTDFNFAAEVAAEYLAQRYKKYKGKTGNVVKDMAWAIKGSSTGVSLTFDKDWKFYKSIDKTWIYGDTNNNPGGTVQ